MCKIVKTYDEPVVRTGYKVAIKIDGKYFSPATGVEYIVGPVPKCPDYSPQYEEKITGICRYFAVKAILEGIFFDPTYNGNTGVFVLLGHARTLFGCICEYEHIGTVVILEMSIMCKYLCEYVKCGTYAGDQIISISEVPNE